MPMNFQRRLELDQLSSTLRHSANLGDGLSGRNAAARSRAHECGTPVPRESGELPAFSWA